jgi:hypothetical protein
MCERLGHLPRPLTNRSPPSGREQQISTLPSAGASSHHVSQRRSPNFELARAPCAGRRRKNRGPSYGHSPRYVPPREIRMTPATVLMLRAPFHSTFGRSGSYQCMSGQLTKYSAFIQRLCSRLSRTPTQHFGATSSKATCRALFRLQADAPYARAVPMSCRHAPRPCRPCG